MNTGQDYSINDKSTTSIQMKYSTKYISKDHQSRYNFRLLCMDSSKSDYSIG